LYEATASKVLNVKKNKETGKYQLKSNAEIKEELE
tara:strand:+ start:488 stop:592 length:105 start_codon:yes stop_codon:yes gene_type:complete